ncbi:MAG: class I SAM-dependent methyltransferase [bacterium]|nr:class I SAM-dependent methyltransferase [bacterium]
MSLQGNYLHEVKDQYEQLPYPPREPAEERERLLSTNLDHLEKINHFCFNGQESFRNGFRVLVAGCGTGDSVVYLAEQLRGLNAEVVALDLSAASLNLARERAEVRGLGDIRWVNGSLLDLPDLNLGYFDYINCSGVLHHLESPERGLAALAGVLRPGGGMGLMVYALYGRLGIYQMQDLTRRFCDPTDSVRTRVEVTRTLLNNLPTTNMFRLFQEHHLEFDEMDTDSGLYDLLLHSQDRAYTVPQIYELCAACNLTHSGFARRRALYMPELLIQESSLLERMQTMPPEEREALAEILWSRHYKHSFYVSTAEDSVAAPDNLELAPLLQATSDVSLGDKIRQLMPTLKPGMQFNIQNGDEGSVDISVGRFTAGIIRHMNGRISLNRIFRKIRKEKQFRAAPPTNEELTGEFLRIYRLLHPLDLILLKDPGIPDFPNTEQLHARMSAVVGSERVSVATL